MDDQIERSPEAFVALAESDPKAWVEAFLEENGLSVHHIDELDSAEPFHGLDLFEVYEEGGHEGDGEHVEKVFAIAPKGSRVSKGRVANASAYVAFYGHYESYNGTEWDDTIHVVEPKDVVVVQYHAKA